MSSIATKLRVWVVRARGCGGRFLGNQDGSYIISAAFLLPVVIGATGLGTEAGLWYYKHQNLQSAADAAAVSAATAYYAQGSNAKLSVEADAVTPSYGLVDGANGVTVTTNQPPKSGSYSATSDAVEVVIQQVQARLFSALWNSDPVILTARAVAVPTGGSGCTLALDPSASGAVTAQGSTGVALNECSLFANSNDPSALTVGGSATISSVAVGVTGGISGQSNITAKSIKTGQSPLADPYADMSYDPYPGCTQHNFSAKSTVTINQGVYCGGITLNAGANVTLNPGVYYLDQGSLKVNGGATLRGDGVTIVFTSSTGHNYATADINGNANINLTAPTSGPTAGIVMFGDRDMPTGTAFKLDGGATQSFGGAIYLPKGAVDYAGGSNANAQCTQIVADTISFTGNSNLANQCSNYSTKAIGSAAASLVQ
jgi:Flp pilus assembly protein TadG